MLSNTPIFIVDDNPIDLSILQVMLEDKYDLELAESGEQCLEKLQKNHPELILLDIEMGGISGIEVCKKIKQDPETKDIKIIFVSGLNQPEQIKAGYAVGADDYVTKPFISHEMLAKIELALTSRIKA